MIVDYRIYMCQFSRYLPYLYHNLIKTDRNHTDSGQFYTELTAIWLIGIILPLFTSCPKWSSEPWISFLLWDNRFLCLFYSQRLLCFWFRFHNPLPWKMDSHLRQVLQYFTAGEFILISVLKISYHSSAHL